MTDKSWLLNAAAIAAAKQCIQAIEEELGVKLKLSHPQFLEMIQQYCELTDSAALQQSYNNLKQFALGAGVSVEPKTVKPEPAKPTAHVNNTENLALSSSQVVTFKGKDYPRFDEEGNEFKGLYRGQARYA